MYFLGSGSVIVSFIECTTPSLNAVPDSARITIDRRLTVGETQETALAELRGLPHIGDAEVELLQYDEVSWRGTRAQQPKYYPTWVLEEEHPLVQGVAEAAAEVLPERPKISRWHFSTNGVATMGRHGIPSVGFAPGLEELAHTTEEWVAVVKPGRVLFELSYPEEGVARAALDRAIQKLPIKARFVSREESF